MCSLFQYEYVLQEQNSPFYQCFPHEGTVPDFHFMLQKEDTSRTYIILLTLLHGEKLHDVQMNKFKISH